MWERVKNSRTISLVVDAEEYEEFKKLLPKNKTVGQYIRKVMKEEVELQKKEEALSSPNYSAIKANNNIESTLDKFFPSHIQNWKDFKEIVVPNLEDSERRIATEWIGSCLGILEAENKKKGSKVYPLWKR